MAGWVLACPSSHQAQLSSRGIEEGYKAASHLFHLHLFISSTVRVHMMQAWGLGGQLREVSLRVHMGSFLTVQEAQDRRPAGWPHASYLVSLQHPLLMTIVQSVSRCSRPTAHLSLSPTRNMYLVDIAHRGFHWHQNHSAGT